MSDDYGGPQLILLDPAAQRTSRIRTGLGGANEEPAWNPKNADLIAFTVRQSSRFRIGLYSFERGSAVYLTDEPGACVEPAWLSDGRHLVFTYRYQGKKQLKILDTKTRRIANLHDPKKLPRASLGDYVGVIR